MTSRIPDLEITSAGIEDERFTFTRKGSRQDRMHGEDVTRYEFEVAFKGGEEIATNRAYVDVATNVEGRAVLRVPVLAEVIGPILVSPNRIQLNGLAPGETFTRDLMIRLRAGPGEFEVAHAAAWADRELGLEVRTESETKNGMKVVTLRLSGVAPEVTAQSGNTIKGKVTFETGIPDQPLVEVPIGGFVRLR
jgi:hypothetical protein